MSITTNTQKTKWDNSSSTLQSEVVLPNDYVFDDWDADDNAPDDSVKCDKIMDDWWEELTVDAVEECEHLAAEASSQMVVTSRLTNNAPMASCNTLPPVCTPVQPRSGTIPVDAAGSALMMSEAQQSVKFVKHDTEYTKLKGENLMLRDSLQRAKKDSDLLIYKKTKELEEAKKTMGVQLEKQDKDLQKMALELQFHKMEAAKMQSVFHSAKLLVSPERADLRQSQWRESHSLGTPMRKHKMANLPAQTSQASTSTALVNSSERLIVENKNDHFSNKQPNKCNFRKGRIHLSRVAPISEGGLLSTLILPQILVRTVVEKAVRFTQDDRWKRRYSHPDVDTKIVGLSGVNLASLDIPLIGLTRMDHFSSPDAAKLLTQVWSVGCNIMRNVLLHLLEARGEANILENEQELYVNAHKILSLDQDYSPLDHREWYVDERCLEARRMVGILAALASSSSHFRYLLLNEPPTKVANVNRGFEIATKATDEVKSSNQEFLEVNTEISGASKGKTPIGKRSLRKGQSSVSHDEISSASPPAIVNNFDCQKENKREMISEVSDLCQPDKYLVKEVGDLLTLVTDFVHSIETKRRSVSHNGFLVAVTLLVTRILQMETQLPPHREKLFIDLIQDLVLCRPSPFGLLKLLCLFTACCSHPAVLDSLCRNAPGQTCESCVEAGVENIVFTPNTCVLQVFVQLVRLLPSIDKVYLLTSALIQWMRTLLTNGTVLPSWLTRPVELAQCSCLSLLIQVVLSSISNADTFYSQHRTVLAEEDRSILEEILENGTLVIKYLLSLDAISKEYREDAEGHYVHFVNTTYYMDPPIQFKQPAKNAFKKLLEMCCEPPLLSAAKSDKAMHVLARKAFSTIHEHISESEVTALSLEQRIEKHIEHLFKNYSTISECKPGDDAEYSALFNAFNSDQQKKKRKAS